MEYALILLILFALLTITFMSLFLVMSIGHNTHIIGFALISLMSFYAFIELLLVILNF